MTRRTPQTAKTARSALREDRTSEVYGKLRELIVLGRLAPGSRIIEADLAGRLEVSRTPVRSALHRLKQEGYIAELDGGQRARLMVAPLTKDDAAELLNIVAVSARCRRTIAAFSVAVYFRRFFLLLIRDSLGLHTTDAC